MPTLAPSQRYAFIGSALIAIVYGTFGSQLYLGAEPHVVGAICKTSAIVILGAIALSTRSRLLGIGLLFGALGDALLAWSPDTFLAGAIAFLIGHLFYITLFLRTGRGLIMVVHPAEQAAVLMPTLALPVTLCLALVPPDNPLRWSICLYAVVLSFMTVTSFYLPRANRLAAVGAVLFFISDIFVAWNKFHPDPDSTLMLWRMFVGWMLYWAGQAGICVGALDLHRRR